MEISSIVLALYWRQEDRYESWASPAKRNIWGQVFPIVPPATAHCRCFGISRWLSQAAAPTLIAKLAADQFARLHREKYGQFVATEVLTAGIDLRTVANRLGHAAL